jgi:dynein light chain LC8-type
MIHGPGWQCVVGPSFIYFKLESLRFLVFKGAAAAA